MVQGFRLASGLLSPGSSGSCCPGHERERIKEVCSLKTLCCPVLSVSGQPEFENASSVCICVTLGKIGTVCICSFSYPRCKAVGHIDVSCCHSGIFSLTINKAGIVILLLLYLGPCLGHSASPEQAPSQSQGLLGLGVCPSWRKAQGENTSQWEKSPPGQSST